MARKQKQASKPPLEQTVREFWRDQEDLSGSKNPWFTCNLANQVLRLPWRGDPEDVDSKQIRDQAMLSAMMGISPRDPTEGMLAAQMLAVHEASMDCFRRAVLPNQTFAGRDMSLKHGAKLARTYAALLETLDRHRGKGQPQVVRVERVTIKAGAQAVVGVVAQGGGDNPKHEDRAHAKQAALANAREPTLRCADPERELVPVARGERS